MHINILTDMQNKNTIHYNDVVGIVKLSLKRRGLQLQLVVMETCFGVVRCLWQSGS